jgi:hypothetical protein
MLFGSGGPAKLMLAQKDVSEKTKLRKVRRQDVVKIIKICERAEYFLCLMTMLVKFLAGILWQP